MLIVFGVGIIQSFFTAERTRALLAGRRESVGNVLAALLGVVTPFCSCSAVPLFLGFVEVGIPLGVTLSFLISAPMVNEVALVLLFGLFGWKIAALYLGTGLLIAMLAGWTIGRIGMERHVEPWVYEAIGAAGESGFDERIPFAERIRHGLRPTGPIPGDNRGPLGVALLGNPLPKPLPRPRDDDHLILQFVHGSLLMRHATSWVRQRGTVWPSAFNTQRSAAAHSRSGRCSFSRI